MNAGETFLIPDGISTHLSFIIAVCPDGALIICHFTTRRRYSDCTCVVVKDEHPFIEKDTVVKYDQAYVCPPDRIINLKNVITKNLENLSNSLLARIRQGALDSPQTPDAIKELLKTL